MRILKFNEIGRVNEYNKKKDILEPLKSFKLHKKLCPDVWDEAGEMKAEVRENLMKLADDTFEALELDVKYDNVVLTGSLANLNYSKYSDFDLHIVLDFSKVDKNVELVRKYFNEYRTNWNHNHDVKINGYDVEIYLQDINEEHVASGLFSLLNNEWMVKPSKFETKVDEQAVKTKSEELMTQVDALEKDFDEMDYDTFTKRVAKVWDKLMKGRKESLSEDGEMGTGNVVFKLLRRNGTIERIIDMKVKAYDREFSR
jgi:predicted nucleotidyltransferase